VHTKLGYQVVFLDLLPWDSMMLSGSVAIEDSLDDGVATGMGGSDLIESPVQLEAFVLHLGYFFR
jgi:hypothetical protein